MGERLLVRARLVTNEVRRAHEEIAQLQGATEGTLRVCLSTVPHIALFPYALKAFRARYPDVKLDVLDGVFPAAEAKLRSGDLDCYVGPAPESVPGAELVVETLFENTRVVVCRRGHPLAKARSLAELVDAEWISTSITFRPEEEMDPLFAQYGLPPPKRALMAHSALTYITAVAYSDFLAMLPVQWAEFEVTRSAIDVIPIAEVLPAPPIRIVRRADLPLTPAAQYFSDMIVRASLHLEQRRSQASRER